MADCRRKFSLVDEAPRFSPDIHLMRRRRADVIEEFFNAVVHENAGRATHQLHPFTYEQVRTKWKRVLENNAATTGDAEVSVPLPAPVPRAASGPATNNNNRGGRGGTAVRGRGAARGGGGGFANRVIPRSNYAGPTATLNRLRACYGFNDSRQPCVRQMRDATTCMDQGPGGNVFIHCCSYWDAGNKRHCLSLNHNRHNGGH